MVMNEPQLDADGYSEEIRRSIVERAMAGVRSRQIEPAPEVLAIYAQYITGAITRQETSNLMADRLEILANRVAKAVEQVGNLG
jgi:hypothetical protein